MTGCQRSMSSVILLPDENGHVGSVIVKNNKDAQVLNQAYSQLNATDSNANLSKTQQNTQAKIETDYKNLLAAQPEKSTSVLLYFDSGTTNLTEASVKLIPDLIKKIKAKLPTELVVIGHADTYGTDKLNDELALKRANIIKTLIQKQLPEVDQIMVKSYGSKDLLINTGPNVREQQNRRVEIKIL